ncbi:MAG TPA: MFS transporter [Dehalococcoidia bacterium]|nr:MFS transporter [Dehalococcoidia bacterium]
MKQGTTDGRAPWQRRMPFFYGWVIVVIALFTTFFGIGLTWAASIFAIPMKEDLGWGNSAFFFALSLRGWTGIVVAPFVGPYMDREHGIRLLALLGGLTNVASLLLISFVQSELQFVLLFGVVGGIAQSLQMGATVIIPKWFVRRRGMAVSLASAGGGLAAFVLPAILVAIDHALGWRSGWLVLALLAFVFSAFPAIFLRREPEDVGLLPDGDGRRPEDPVMPPQRTEASFTRTEAMHTRTFWILTVAVAFGALAANGMPANLTNLFVDRGMDLDTAATALVFYGVASIGAKFFWGWLANRFELRFVLLLLTAYGALAIPAILLVPSSVGSPALAYGALVGFYVGAYIPLHFLVWAAYFGRAHVGAISGVGRPLGAMTLAGGPFVIALARDASGTYASGLLLAAAGIALAFACLYFVQPPRRPKPEIDRKERLSTV